MTREDVKKAAEKIVMDWRNADRPALEKFLPKELAEIINAALEEAADEVAKRVIGGRAWNENQALEGRVVAACAATVRARKIP